MTAKISQYIQETNYSLGNENKCQIAVNSHKIRYSHANVFYAKQYIFSFNTYLFKIIAHG